MSSPLPDRMLVPPSELPDELGGGALLPGPVGENPAPVPAAGASSFFLIGRSLSDGVGSFQTNRTANSYRGFTLTPLGDGVVFPPSGEPGPPGKPGAFGIDAPIPPGMNG